MAQLSPATSFIQRIYVPLLLKFTCTCFILYTHSYGTDQVINLFKTDLFNNLFQYLTPESSNSLRRVCKDFNNNKKIKDFFDYQNNLIHTQYGNSDQKEIIADILSTQNPTPFTPSIILSPDGKRGVCLVLNNVNTNEKSLKYNDHMLTRTFGAIINTSQPWCTKEFFRSKTTSTIDYQIKNNSEYEYKTTNIPLDCNSFGYRDPKGRYFLFVTPGSYSNDTVLMSLSWNSFKENHGQIECLGEINLWRDIKDIKKNNKDWKQLRSINSIESKENLITFHFTLGTSIIIDSETKKIVNQIRPFDICPIPAESTYNYRSTLILYIEKMAQESPIIKSFTQNNEGLLAIDLYTPSISLDNTGKQFSALGFAANNNESYTRSFYIIGSTNIENNQLILKPIRTDLIYPYEAHSNLKIETSNFFFPGYSDTERSFFIFPAYLLETRLLRGEMGNMGNYVNLLVLDGNKTFGDKQEPFEAFDNTLNGYEYPITEMKSNEKSVTFKGKKPHHHEDQSQEILTLKFNLSKNLLITNEASNSIAYDVLTAKEQKENNRKFNEVCANKYTEVQKKILEEARIRKNLNKCSFLGSFLKLSTQIIRGPQHIPSLFSDIICLSGSFLGTKAYQKNKIISLIYGVNFCGSLYSLAFLSTIIHQHPLLYTAYGLVDLLQIYSSAKRLSWI